jgi:hypothetical protein
VTAAKEIQPPMLVENISIPKQFERELIAQHKLKIERGYTDAEFEHLSKLERDVSKWMSSSIHAAKSLFELHECEAFWRLKADSFEEYCLKLWQYSCSHAYRLKDAGEVIFQLQKAYDDSPNGERKGSEWFPRSEAQLRPLVQLKTQEHRVACWREIVAKTPAYDLTAHVISRKTTSYIEKNKIEIPKKPRPPANPQGALTRLNTAVKDHPRAEQIRRHIEAIQQLFTS